MKSKFIYLLLLLTALLAGCGKHDTNDDMYEFGEIEVEVQTEAAGDSDGEAENSGGVENSAGQAENAEGETTEQQPYILTFEATTTEGETLTSDCLADSKLTMINVWATYCNPCLAEMPDLGEIAAEYDKAEFQILGIVSDVMEGDSAENVDYAKDLITETEANYPHLLLNQSLYSNLVGGIEAVPTTFFVKQDGEVLGYVVGAGSKESWVELINQLLAEID